MRRDHGQQLYLTQQHPLSFVTDHAGSRKASATFQSEAIRICLLTHVKVASNCSPKAIPLEGNVRNFEIYRILKETAHFGEPSWISFYLI